MYFLIFCLVVLAIYAVILIAIIGVSENQSKRILLANKEKGKQGEELVALELKKLPQEYIVLNNQVLIDSNNNSHQIDHIVISHYGIFVIETKNFDGYIRGNKYSDKWMQYFGKNKRIQFKNLLHQNYGHILALQDILKLDNNKFFLIICFTGNSKLNIGNVEEVVKLDYLISKILSYSNIILDFNLNMIKEYIENISNDIEENHIEKVRQKCEEERIKIENNICPKCGGNLIIQTGKYGDFIGCANYPSCKFSKNKS